MTESQIARWHADRARQAELYQMRFAAERGDRIRRIKNVAYRTYLFIKGECYWRV